MHEVYHNFVSHVNLELLKVPNVEPVIRPCNRLCIGPLEHSRFFRFDDTTNEFTTPCLFVREHGCNRGFIASIKRLSRQLLPINKNFNHLYP